MRIHLPSSSLSGNKRSAARFCVLGFSGTLFQEGCFLLILLLLGHPDKGTFVYNVAFGAGFICEMIPNFLLTNFYVFETRPSVNKAGGFLLARLLNLVIQFGFLHWLISLLPSWKDGILSFVCIVLAGIVNYMVLRLFFKNNGNIQA